MEMFPKQKEQHEMLITASAFVLAVSSFENDNIVITIVIEEDNSLAKLFQTSVKAPGR